MPEFSIFFPAHVFSGSLTETLRCLLRQSCRDWSCRIEMRGGGDARTERLLQEIGDGRIQASAERAASDAHALNRMIHEADSRFIIPLTEGILLRPEAFGRIRDKFENAERAGVVYSSYHLMDAYGAERLIRLHAHEGNIHERFSFGHVKAYRTDRLREAGGFRTDLTHAADYDIDLKIGDRGTHEFIDEPLYTVKFSNSPGLLLSVRRAQERRRYGGWSYLFYSPELEREISGVFRDMLERRTALLRNEAATVPRSRKASPVRASVVIPVLNRAEFIGGALESVLRGTFGAFEILVVDNGSRDGTQDVVGRYARKDPRVRMIQIEGSIASAFNTAMRSSRGTYICLLDSDDEYAPHAIEKAVAYLDAHPRCGLVSSHYVLMDENGKEIADLPVITHDVYSRDQLLRHDGIGQLRAFPRAVLEEMGGCDESFGSYGEDYDLALRISEKYEIGRVPEILYRCRRHGSNTEHILDPLLRFGNKNRARLNAIARRQALWRSQEKEAAGIPEEV
jgi:GT2 family glycosyltransferase